MNEFQIGTIQDLHSDAITMIGKEWMLVTAKKGDQVNTLTASWGGLGVLWGKPVAFVFIRPQRYTKQFIDASDMLSLSFYDETYRNALTYFGRISGKDEDKISKMDFHIKEYNDCPYFEEANTVLICKKLFVQELDANSFIDPLLCEAHYPNHDLHTMYVVEICETLIKK